MSQERIRFSPHRGIEIEAIQQRPQEGPYEWGFVTRKGWTTSWCSNWSDVLEKLELFDGCSEYAGLMDWAKDQPFYHVVLSAHEDNKPGCNEQEPACRV